VSHVSQEQLAAEQADIIASQPQPQSPLVTVPTLEFESAAALRSDVEWKWVDASPLSACEGRGGKGRLGSEVGRGGRWGLRCG
jgi:hypothetical protein